MLYFGLIFIVRGALNSPLFLSYFYILTVILMPFVAVCNRKNVFLNSSNYDLGPEKLL